jgi:hypothetical protein
MRRRVPATAAPPQLRVVTLSDMAPLMMILASAVIWLGLAVFGCEAVSACLSGELMDRRALIESAVFLLCGAGLLVAYF